MSAAECDRVSTEILAHPTDFEGDDVQPRRLPKALAEGTEDVPVPRRTVFQPLSDWGAACSVAVLDALDAAYSNEVAGSETSRADLSLSRCAGSVSIDASIADLFDPQCAHPSRPNEPGDRVLQCGTCGRPVLLTRFVNHARKCTEPRTRRDSPTQTLKDAEDNSYNDEQLELVCSPYGASEKDDDESQRGLRHHGQSRTILSPSKVDECGEPKAHRSPGAIRDMEWDTQVDYDFPLEEDEWEESLQCLAPERMLRGACSSRRRVALPAPSESASQRKRTLNAEKKALIVAGISGIHPIPGLRKQTGPCPKERYEDPIRQTALLLGDTAPWSKLMQISMPATVPRTPRVRVLPAQETDSLSKSTASTGGFAVGVNGVGNGKGKAGEVAEKSFANSASAAPSLVGSLMWLRARGMKELGNTALYNMDVPHTSVGRSGAIFHGQTYVAEMGTFNTDPRARTSIKMPLGTAQSLHSAAKISTVPLGSSKMLATTDAKTKKSQGAASTSLSNSNALSQQPAQKRQRVSKNQRTSAAGSNGQMPNGPPGSKVGISVAKNAAASRAQAVVPERNAKSASTSIDSQQRAPLSRKPPQISTAMGGSSTVAPALTPGTGPPLGSQHFVHQPKKGFRQMSGAGAMGLAARMGSAQPPQAAGVSGSGVYAPGKSAGRVGKSRPLAASIGNNVNPAARTAVVGKGRASSPSQGSSRSGERTSLHRGSPMSTGAYDPVLVSPSLNPGIASMGRVAGVPGTPTKQQLGFQQAMAQAGAKGLSGTARNLPVASSSHIAVQQGSTKGQAFPVGKAHNPMQRTNIRGIPPHSRVKQTMPPAAAQGRLIPGLKNSGRPQPRMPVRKVVSDSQPSMSGIDAMRRSEAASGSILAGNSEKIGNSVMFAKRGGQGNVMGNQGTHEAQGFYNPTVAVGSSQLGNEGAMKNPGNLALLRLAQANQNAVQPSGVPGNPVMLQNVQDMRHFQNVGVSPEAPTGAHNANVLSFLQATGMSGGMGNSGVASSPMGSGMRGGAMPGPTNSRMMNAGDAILQQILSGGRPQGMTPNMQLYGQPGIPQPGQLNPSHGHLAARSAGLGLGMNANTRPVLQAAPNAMIDEIDRALGLSFEESDLVD